MCEIGPADKADWGQVEIEVNGGKRGTSSVSFTYRVNAYTHTYTHMYTLSSAARPPLSCTTSYSEIKLIQKLSADFVVLWTVLCFPFISSRETLIKTYQGHDS